MRSLLAGLLCAAFCFAADLAERKALTLAAAKQIASAAEAEARKNNWNVVIAVVDEGGHLLYLQRMDDTQIGSIEIAQRKATTSVFFKRPTKAMEDALVGGRTALLAFNNAIPVEGGMPITVDGRVIGAIGVSGVLSTQDAQIAKAGLDALK